MALEAGANMGWLPLLSPNAEFCTLETDIVKAVELCKTLMPSGRATSREHQGCASGKGRGRHARRASSGVSRKMAPSRSLNRMAREKREGGVRLLAVPAYKWGRLDLGHSDHGGGTRIAIPKIGTGVHSLRHPRRAPPSFSGSRRQRKHLRSQWRKRGKVSRQAHSQGRWGGRRV